MQATPHGSDLREKPDQRCVPPGGSSGRTFFPGARQAGSRPGRPASVNALRSSPTPHHRHPPTPPRRPPISSHRRAPVTTSPDPTNPQPSATAGDFVVLPGRHHALLRAPPPPSNGAQAPDWSAALLRVPDRVHGACPCASHLCASSSGRYTGAVLGCGSGAPVAGAPPPAVQETRRSWSFRCRNW